MMYCIRKLQLYLSGEGTGNRKNQDMIENLFNQLPLREETSGSVLGSSNNQSSSIQLKLDIKELKINTF